ncbi:hypothetical protein SPWS13_4499 [Shewanella putrefaciens]|nr:hypothetical protein SPWS13_4499 [Shewanella putrefaciens]
MNKKRLMSAFFVFLPQKNCLLAILRALMPKISNRSGFCYQNRGNLTNMFTQVI